MRAETLVPKAVRVTIALASLLGAAGCSKVPVVGGPAKARVRVTASADLNDCGKGAASPLTYRIVQVTDASAMTGTTLAQVWGREDKLLAAAYVTRSQDSVDPGGKRDIGVELDPKAKAVIVIGNFCKSEGSCWYYVAQRKGGGGMSIRLAAASDCLRPTR
jgi:type VI secretion system VasD/TssJ family lipoprotein